MKGYAVFHLRTASRTDTGRVRKNNEDSYGDFKPEDPAELTEKGSLFIVADGMGGHIAGEVASRLAVETIRSQYFASKKEDPSEALTEAFEAANRIIFEQSKGEGSLVGMGTTCTAMVIRGDKAHFAHVGDSRAYLFRKGELKQLTDDHSLVGEMMRSGMISREDARLHPQRNVITRSLGAREVIEMDTPASPFNIAGGDMFLLCSDGLTALVRDDEIRSILEMSVSGEACSRLIDRANERGGTDNVTVQIIEVLEQ